MSEAKPSTPRPRIQGLSDLIFGLALSIGALQLIGNPPMNSAQVLNSLIVFGFSFLILINVWLRYTTIASVMPVETTAMVRLNMLLLFLVTIEPYLFNILTKEGLATTLGQDVSGYYALDIAGMNLVIAYFIHLTTIEEKKLIPSELTHRFKLNRNYILAVGLIFAVSAIPTFATVALFGTSLRVVLWLLTVPVIWLSRASGKASDRIIKC